MVLKGESPEACLENFFKGLGSLFRNRRAKRSQASELEVDLVFAKTIGNALNEICCAIELGLPPLVNLGDQPVRSTDVLRQKLVKDLFQGFSDIWTVSEGKFDVNPGRIHSQIDPSEAGDEKDQRRVLVERLAAAREVAAHNASLVVEAREAELAALKVIAKLRHEIADSTGGKSEERGASLADDKSSETQLEPLDPRKKYPVGGGVDPLDWLRVHWGHRLKYFGAPADSLYLDQLRHLDNGLLRSLQNRFNYMKRCSSGENSSALSLREIIPSKADRNSRRIEHLKEISPADAAALLYRYRKGGLKAS